MFERQKKPVNKSILLHIPIIPLFQTIINVWCKSGVKLKMGLKAGFLKAYTVQFIRPGLLYRYNAFKHNASMVKWHHTVLVRLNSLVS